MAAGLRVGVNQKLYRNTGTWASPVWNEVTIARDVSLGLSQSKAEIKARLSGYAMTLPGIKSAPLEFDILADTSVDDYNVLRDAFINGTLIGFAVADDAIATVGTDYWKGEYYVHGFALDQKLEDAEMVKVTCDLAYSANVPIWIDV